MKLFDSVLLPVSRKSTEDPENHLIANALAITAWLEATLHFLVPTRDVTQLRRVLARFYRPRPMAPYFVDESVHSLDDDLLELARSTPNALLVLGIDRESSFEFLERISDPILFCPIGFTLSIPPFDSLLVPTSGETHLSAALELALRFAIQQKIPIDLMYVTKCNLTNISDSSPLGQTSDSFYHEYPRLIERLISKAIPYSHCRERQVIREFWHCCGDRADEILKRTVEKRTSLPILEWKGKWREGRAEVLRMVAIYSRNPTLLVREVKQPSCVLKVAKAFESKLVS